MHTGSSSAHRSDINVTPLIDVLLVLLIIFMVIQPTLLRGLDAVAPLPAKHDHAEPDPQTLVLEVRAGAHHETVYALNQTAVPVGDLTSVLTRLLAVRSNKVIFVRGDPSLDYAAIAPALDKARSAGAESIGLLTPRSF